MPIFGHWKLNFRLEFVHSNGIVIFFYSRVWCAQCLTGDQTALTPKWSRYPSRLENLATPNWSKIIHSVANISLRCQYRTKDQCVKFLFKWANPVLFLVYFRPFLIAITITVSIINVLTWKKHRWCAWDSNLGPQNGRRRQNHWAMAAAQMNFSENQRSEPL